jgi:hypothetical protein
MITVACVLTLGGPVLAHITPVVVLRRQADVIRNTLPSAVRFEATDVRPGQSQLEQIISRAKYTPNVPSIRFYDGRDGSGRLVGTVLFPQVDTQHGPIEVGVTIDPDGAVRSAQVTRATVEMKPWILDLERSNALSQLDGKHAADFPVHLGGNLGGMAAYMADAIAQAVYRAVILQQVLHPAAT